MSHNWSATKQRLHPQSVAEINRYSVLSGDRIRRCEISPQGHGSVKYSYLLTYLHYTEWGAKVSNNSAKWHVVWTMAHCLIHSVTAVWPCMRKIKMWQFCTNHDIFCWNSLTAGEHASGVEGISVERHRLLVDVFVKRYFLCGVHVLADERIAEHIIHCRLQLRLVADQRQCTCDILLTDLQQYKYTLLLHVCVWIILETGHQLRTIQGITKTFTVVAALWLVA